MISCQDDRHFARIQLYAVIGSLRSRYEHVLLWMAIYQATAQRSFMGLLDTCKLVFLPLCSPSFKFSCKAQSCPMLLEVKPNRAVLFA